MKIAEAKEVLLLYRPGITDAADPQMAEALEMARTDTELGKWFEEHRAFQKAMRARFRELELPAHLKASLLIRGTAQAQIPRPRAWWRNPLWITAAAAVAALFALASIWLKPSIPNRFANYKARMVTEAQRAEYRMDLVTNDMSQVRQLMASRGAPADYELPQGLEQMRLTGGAVLNWRDKPVSMVCFERHDKQMVFLFVMQRSAVKDPPPQEPAVVKVSKLLTASWSRRQNTYILAGPEEADFLKKYL